MTAFMYPLCPAANADDAARGRGLCQAALRLPCYMSGRAQVSTRRKRGGGEALHRKWGMGGSAGIADQAPA